MNRSLVILYLAVVGLLCILSFVSPPPVYQTVFGVTRPSAFAVDLAGVGLATLAILSFNYAVVGLFGYSLAYPLFRGLPGVALPVKIVASFFVGYIAALPIIRLVAFCFPYACVYWPTLILLLAYIVVVLICNRGSINAWLVERRRAGRFGAVQSWVFVASILAMFLLALVIQIHQQDFHWTGHGFFYRVIDKWSQNQPLHLPIVREHYDELIFTIFLGRSLTPDVHPLVLGWLTLGLNKASIFAFFALMFMRLGLRWGAALFLSLFFMMGTTALLPTKFYMLFEYGNPMLYEGTCRMIGVAFVLALIMNFIQVRKDRSESLPSAFFLFGGLGVSAMSIHVPAWVFLAPCIMFACWSAVTAENTGGRIGKTLQGSRLNGGLIYAAVLVSLVLFWLPFNEYSLLATRALLVFAVVAVLLIMKGIVPLVAIVNRRQITLGSVLKENVGSIIVMASIVLGLLLLGNVVVDNPVSRWFVEMASSIFGPVTYDTSLQYDLGLRIKSMPGSMAILGDYRDMGRANIHSQYALGLLPFCAFYGGILAMMLSVHFLHRWRERNDQLELTDHLLYELFVWLSVGLLALFFFRDFTKYLVAYDSSWNKTRFTEIPIYLIEFIFLYYLYRCRGKLIRTGIVIVLMVYMVVPFWATDRFAQLELNTGLFRKLLVLNTDRYHELKKMARSGGPMDINAALELAKIYEDLWLEREFYGIAMGILQADGLPDRCYSSAAGMLARAGRPDFAAAGLQRHLSRNPKSSSLQIDLAVLQLVMGQRQAAEVSLWQAVAIGGDVARDLIRNDRRLWSLLTGDVSRALQL